VVGEDLLCIDIISFMVAAFEKSSGLGKAILPNFLEGFVAISGKL
jgi:hypothetical protein